jgi:hypothetical protein
MAKAIGFILVALRISIGAIVVDESGEVWVKERLCMFSLYRWI